MAKKNPESLNLGPWISSLSTKMTQQVVMLPSFSLILIRVANIDTASMVRDFIHTPKMENGLLLMIKIT